MPKSRQKKIKAVDPFCTGNRKKLLLAKEKDLNQAPKNVSSQPIPRSLKDMIKAAKMADQTQDHKVQKIGSVERRPGETHNHFMKRIGLNAKKKLKATRAKLESDDMTSTDRIQTEAAVRKRKERIAELQQRRKGKKFERKLEDQEKDFYKDHVQFGEVVSAPPIFSAKPRKSNANTDKAGNRQLLLSSLLQQKSPQDDKPVTKQPNRTTRLSHDQSAKIKKRKNMTNAEKRSFDRSREAAISAYRKAKGH